MKWNDKFELGANSLFSVLNFYKLAKLKKNGKIFWIKQKNKVVNHESCFLKLCQLEK